MGMINIPIVVPSAEKSFTFPPLFEISICRRELQDNAFLAGGTRQELLRTVVAAELAASRAVVKCIGSDGISSQNMIRSQRTYIGSQRAVSDKSSLRMSIELYCSVPRRCRI